MSSVSAVLGASFDPHPLKVAFLKWQCHVRQIAMRDNAGRPDDSFMPEVTLAGGDEPLGHIITVLNKSPGYSLTPEMLHMARKTNDPAQIREAALNFLSATYYQKHAEFSDTLTATFPPGSPGAAQIRAAGRATLTFEAYSQYFDLDCKVSRLTAHNPLFAATIAHNRLFNPVLPGDSEVLAFEPDWDQSSADPDIARR